MVKALECFRMAMANAWTHNSIRLEGGKGMPLNLSDNEITMGLAVGLLLGEDAILE